MSWAVLLCLGSPLDEALAYEGFPGDGPGAFPAVYRVGVSPTPGAIHGQVTNEEESPIAGARLTLAVGETSAELSCDDQGRFEIDAPLPGPITVTAVAEGYRQAVIRTEVPRGRVTELQMFLEPELPRGQICGEVCPFNSRPLVATIDVAALALRHQTDQQGAFELIIPPRADEIQVNAQGFVTQRQRVIVEYRGVVLLNVDLRPERRRWPRRGTRRR